MGVPTELSGALSATAGLVSLSRAIASHLPVCVLQVVRPSHAGTHTAQTGALLCVCAEVGLAGAQL